jgi:hypothetical protein
MLIRDKDGLMKLKGDTRAYVQCHECKECDWKAQDICTPRRGTRIKCPECGTWDVFTYTEGMTVDDGVIVIVWERCQ